MLVREMRPRFEPSPRPETFRCHHKLNQRPQCAAVLLHVSDGGIDGRSIRQTWFAAQRIGQQLAGQARQKLFRLTNDGILQVANTIDLCPIRQLRRRINLWIIALDATFVAVTFLLTIFTTRVEMFESKSKRINLVVTACTLRQRAMNLQTLTHRGLVDARNLWSNLAGIGDGQSGIGPEHILHDPCAAFDG